MISAERAKRIKLLALDVDGVLTDNAVWIGPIDDHRVEFKRFDISDGLGMLVLGYTGVDLAWVSGRKSGATALRAQELRIPTVVQESGARKLPAVEALLQSKGLAWEELAFVGDDLADLPLLRRAGLAVTVANGCPEVKAVAHWTTKAAGGFGAVREVIEELLKARGEWDKAVTAYLHERGETI